jgi:hypothetical protein
MNKNYTKSKYKVKYYPTRRKIEITIKVQMCTDTQFDVARSAPRVCVQVLCYRAQHCLGPSAYINYESN